MLKTIGSALAGWSGGGDDVLSGHRERIMYPMAIAVTAMLLPFSINNFLQGRHAIGVLVTLVLLGFGADALAIRWNRRPPVPYALLLLCPLLHLFMHGGHGGAPDQQNNDGQHRH